MKKTRKLFLKTTLVLGLGMVVLAAFPGVLTAGKEDASNLDPLVEKVRTLVLKHYPKAEVKLREGKILVFCNTRKFMVHHPLLDGSYQDATEMTGPQKGGILAELELRPGMYGGMAAVPQTFNYHYFKLDLLAPYSKKLNSHLYVHLYYPRDASPEFVRDFGNLVDSFDKHVLPPSK